MQPENKTEKKYSLFWSLAFSPGIQINRLIEGLLPVPQVCNSSLSSSTRLAAAEQIYFHQFFIHPIPSHQKVMTSLLYNPSLFHD